MREASSVRFEAEDVRRRQLIEATIESLADVGFAACTLMDIARRAGVSPGLVAHYFGDKEGLLEATLRHLAGRLSRLVARRLAQARTPRERIQAVIDANLAPEEFDRRTASVWLAFWGQVIHSVRFKRVQNVYQRRMLSNLRHGLRRLVSARDAERTAVAIAAVIDGLWLRETLAAEGEPESAEARAIATAFVDAQLAAIRQRVGASAEAEAEGAAEPILRSYVGGRAHPAVERGSFPTFEPATGAVLAEIEIAGEAEVAAAVASAKSGQGIWAAMTASERGKVMARAAHLLRGRGDELARLETRDTGRPIRDTGADVAAAADCLDRFAGLAATLAGEHVDLGSQGFGYARPEPLGVIVAAGRCGDPLWSACSRAAPALAAGNAIVFRPSELASLAALKLAEILSEAGLPDGVFNVVLGPARTGDLLMRQPDIALAAGAAEPSGKPALIVFDDAPLDDAVAAVLQSCILGAGRASGAARVFVQEAIRPAFLDKLAARIRGAVVGDPLDVATEVGALVSDAGLQDVLCRIEEAGEQGARRLVGGHRLAEGGLAKGAFLAPALLDGCADDMAIVRDQVLAPVVAVLAFAAEDEAVARANAGLHGCAACLFTRDLARGHRVVAQLRADTGWINRGPLSPAERSAPGAEDARAALQAHLRRKRVYVHLGAD
ncbi:choline-responsive transcriptional repressor BetI [Kaistia nematophila]|uniref:HTH-type transcriptional regulator BetI n=1 Tax=Kaistia nematophila TaxID=2994654 RepID=A0A9X3E551_9HYPH|nr:transcriptional regulator BetI [Kaistia nematophila]MCX5572034.1 transcriptional regulator BetI [Kaistia nematophila]